MKILYGCVLMVLLFGAATVAHPNDPPMSAEAQAIAREALATRDAIKAAVVAKDATALQRLIAPGFTHTHGSGKVDGRDARIVSLLTGEPVIEMAPVEEMRVRVHGTTAIVTGKSPILNKAENRVYDFRWLQVYVKESGTWRLAVSQATRLPS